MDVLINLVTMRSRSSFFVSSLFHLPSAIRQCLVRFLNFSRIMELIEHGSDEGDKKASSTRGRKKEKTPPTRPMSMLVTHVPLFPVLRLSSPLVPTRVETVLHQPGTWVVICSWGGTWLTTFVQPECTFIKPLDDWKFSVHLTGEDDAEFSFPSPSSTCGLLFIIH